MIGLSYLSLIFFKKVGAIVRLNMNVTPFNLFNIFKNILDCLANLMRPCDCESAWDSYSYLKHVFGARCVTYETLDFSYEN